MTASQLLDVKGITKRFPGVLALDDVSMSMRAAEVHALVGENGAGKSTLIKIIGGLYRPDAGEIYLHDKKVSIHSPHDAQRLGISIVFQEPNIVPEMSVAKNLSLGREPVSRPFGIVDYRKMNQQTATLLSRFGIELDPQVLAKHLSVGQRQMLEIARATAFQASLLILDEPTAPLSFREIDVLFETIRGLKAQGVTVVYVSHRLDEVFQIADRITVFRDGRLIQTADATALDTPSLVGLMVGRPLSPVSIPSLSDDSPERLRVEGFVHSAKGQRVSFSVHRGEVVGMAGLVGAGRTELARALYGMIPYSEGSVYIDGKKVHIRGPHDALRAGIVYISEDRKQEAIFPELCVAHNIIAGNYPLVTRLRFIIDPRKQNSLARRQVASFDIRTPGLGQIVNRLSGGNQQKVALARSLCVEPKVLILDEPTQGIDVGAREEIYSIVADLAARGVGIILISSDMVEVLRLSHRILVLRGGSIVDEVSRETATQDMIFMAASGVQ